MEIDVDIEYDACDSKNYEGLQLADWVSNFVWRRFEKDEADPYNVVYGVLNRKHLFMSLNGH